MRSKWISEIVCFIMLASFQKAHHSFACNRQMTCVVTGNEPTPLYIYNFHSAGHKNIILPVFLSVYPCRLVVDKTSG